MTNTGNFVLGFDETNKKHLKNISNKIKNILNC